MSVQKDNVIKSVIASITRLDTAKVGLVGDIQTFIARGYAEGGDDPMTEGDLASHGGITLEKFTAAKNLVDNLVLFLENGQPVQADYQKIIDNLKIVS